MEYIIKYLGSEDVNENVKMVFFEKPNGFKFIPGHTAMISIEKEGMKESLVPFTFISTNKDPYLAFAIKKREGKISEEMHKLQIGDKVKINSIFGTIRYKGVGNFIVSGIAITPVISIMRDLKLNDKETRGNKLIWSNGFEKDIIFLDELESYFGKDNIIHTLTKERKDGFLFGRIGKNIINNIKKDENNYVIGSDEFVFDVRKIISELFKKI